MGTAVEVKLLGPLEVCADGRADAGRRRQAAVVCSRCSPWPRRTSCRATTADRGALGRRPAGQPGQRAAGPGLPPAPAARDATSSSGRARATCCDLDPDLIDAIPPRTPGRRGAGPRRPTATTASPSTRSGTRSRWCAAHRSATCGDAWFARDAVVRLDELVLPPTRASSTASCRMGRHADVARRTSSTSSSRYPLRERFRAQLIIALYRCGRQADALQAYRDARQYLARRARPRSRPRAAGPRAVRAGPRSCAGGTDHADPDRGASDPVVPTPLTSFVGRQRRAGRARRRRGRRRG